MRDNFRRLLLIDDSTYSKIKYLYVCTVIKLCDVSISVK